MANTVKEIKDYQKDSTKEINDLKKEMTELKALLKAQASETGGQVGNTFSAAKHSVTALAADAGAKARTILDNKKDQAAHLADEGKATIYKNPFESVGASFLAGALVSLLFFRK